MRNRSSIIGYRDSISTGMLRGKDKMRDLIFQHCGRVENRYIIRVHIASVHTNGYDLYPHRMGQALKAEQQDEKQCNQSHEGPKINISGYKCLFIKS